MFYIVFLLISFSALSDSGDLGKSYYDNGRLEYEGSVENGKMHGQGKFYAENGQLEYEGSFEKGKQHGKGKRLRKDGSIAYEGEWEQGRRTRSVEEHVTNIGLMVFFIVLPQISTYFLSLLNRKIVDVKTRFYLPQTREIGMQADPGPRDPLDCAVCLESLFSRNVQAVALECGHMLHLKCWKKTAGNACPMCRDISQNALRLFY